MLDFTNINETDWNFKVNEVPLTAQGSDTPIEGWKVLVREDTGTPLHVHRNSYKMLSHDDVVNATYDSIKQTNISQDFGFDVKSLDDGRKLQIEVLFNDLVAEPAVGDYCKYRIRVWNSYDGTYAYQTVADAMRLWCLNGCTTPDSISKVWMRHTSQVSVEGAAEKISNGLEIFHGQKELWQGWMKQKITAKKAENFFKKYLINHQTKSSEEKYNSKQLEKLMGQLKTEIKDLGSNKWALYNCMTHWATHTTEHKSPVSVTRDREQKIAKAINTKAWAEI